MKCGTSKSYRGGREKLTESQGDGLGECSKQLLRRDTVALDGIDFFCDLIHRLRWKQ